MSPICSDMVSFGADRSPSLLRCHGGDGHLGLEFEASVAISRTSEDQGRAVLRLNIGLAAWIIQDGNYADFEAGQEYRFALEFFADQLEVSSRATPSLTLVEDFEYQFSGEVVASDPKLTILDVGMKCYHDGPLALGLEPGQWVEGRLTLGVDPFSWKETHSRRPGVPNLAYSWLLHKILLDETPWEESTESDGRRVLKRAHGSKTYRSISQTNAWEDDGGNGEYILDCELRALTAE